MPKNPNDPPDPTVVHVVRPQVIRVEVEKRGKKRGSSRASRRLIDIESRVSKSASRVSKAVKNGVDRYREARDDSARKRRDGALVDLYENIAEGVSRTLSESSPVLTDFAKALNTRRQRKFLRRAIRYLPVG